MSKHLKSRRLHELKRAVRQLEGFLDKLERYERKDEKYYKTALEDEKRLRELDEHLSSYPQRYEDAIRAFRESFAKDKELHFPPHKDGSEEWFKEYFERYPHRKKAFVREEKKVRDKLKEDYEAEVKEHQRLARETYDSLSNIERDFKRMLHILKSMQDVEEDLEEDGVSFDFLPRFLRIVRPAVEKGDETVKRLLSSLQGEESFGEELEKQWKDMVRPPQEARKGDLEYVRLELEDLSAKFEKEEELLGKTDIELSNEFSPEGSDKSYEVFCTRKARKDLNHHLEDRLLSHFPMMLDVARQGFSRNKSYRFLPGGVIDAKLDDGARVLYKVEHDRVFVLRVFSSSDHDDEYVAFTNDQDAIRKEFKRCSEKLELFTPQKLSA